MGTDFLVEKLAQMAVRRELMERRLSLREALEVLADLADAPDTKERTRWIDHVSMAHTRGDFRFLHELDRGKWSAVRFGREVPVWSLLEVAAAMKRTSNQRVKPGTLEASNDPTQVLLRAEIRLASKEGRIFHGGGMVAKPIPFRSAKDPAQFETPADVEREIDRKLALMESVAQVNQGIDDALARVDARLANGESVLPTASTLSLLKGTIDAVASIPSGELRPLRMTDPGFFPRWQELLDRYTDAWSKLGSVGTNRAVQLTMALAAVWERDDAATQVLVEAITGSAEPLPVELVAVDNRVSAGDFGRW